MSDNNDGRYHGLPMIPAPARERGRAGRVQLDLCPSCGLDREVDGDRRFLPHPEANLDPEWPVNCWTGGRTRTDAELAEAHLAGSTWESLG